LASTRTHLANPSRAQQAPGEEIGRVHYGIHREIFQLREVGEEKEENQHVHSQDIPVRLRKQVAQLVAAGE
jgi:hypothetical protein